jgi:hypothetical protein
MNATDILASQRFYADSPAVRAINEVTMGVSVMSIESHERTPEVEDKIELLYCQRG